MDPQALIAWIDDITSPTTAAGEDVVSYNPLDPIADQAVRHDLEMKIEPDRILLRTERFRPTGKMVDEAPEIGEIYPDVFDVRSFESWWRETSARSPKLLTMREQDLLEGEARSDAVGCSQMQLDAVGCNRMQSDAVWAGVAGRPGG